MFILQKLILSCGIPMKILGQRHGRQEGFTLGPEFHVGLFMGAGGFAQVKCEMSDRVCMYTYM